MPILSNLNRANYWDDFDPDNNFYRILFNSGRPVQARELTQLQSILGNQIEEFASRFFKNGDVLVGGGFSIGNPSKYVRLSSFTRGARVEDFIGYVLTGVVSGAKAEVHFATPADNSDDATVFINYIDSGVNADQQQFVEGEVLESNHPDNYTAVVGINNTSRPIDTPAMGDGSLITVEASTYYVNGMMVRTPQQTIALEKYNTKPTWYVGYIVDEDFITADDDESLKDNAQGYSNFAAPGADRLKISLNLGKKKEDTELPNFIPVVNLLQGNIVGNPSQTVKWDWLYDILAMRTFEESGDYIVTDFPIKPMEYWNDETVDGLVDSQPDIYGENTPYPPIPGDKDRTPLTFQQADSKYVLQISPGLAYVQGYRVGYTSPFYIYGDKPRTLGFDANTFTQINPGVFLKLNNVHGTPDFDNIRRDINTQAFNNIVTYRNFIDGHVGTAFGVNNYSDENDPFASGDRRPQNTGNAPWTTYHLLLNDVLKLDIESGSTQLFRGQQKVTVTGPGNKNFEAIVVYPNSNTTTKETDPIESGKIIRDPSAGRDDFLVAEGGDKDGGYIITEAVDGGSTETILRQESRSFVLAIDGDLLGVDLTEELLDLYTINRGDRITYGGNSAYVWVSERIDPIKTGVIAPKYIEPDTLVQTQNGFYGYNSIYDLGVLSSEFFTELAIFEDPNNTGNAQYPEKWIIGGIVQGEISGATAKLEQARDNFLVVSNINGQFINGENIIQFQSELPGTDDSRLLRDPLGDARFVAENGDVLLLERGSPNVIANIKVAKLLLEGEIVGFNFNSDYTVPGVGGGSASVFGSNTLSVVGPYTIVPSTGSSFLYVYS